MKKFITALLLMTGLIPGLTATDAKFKPPVEVFFEKFLDSVSGKRVGLITNPTDVNSALHSAIDLLYAAEGVELTARFGPGHGIRGNVGAGTPADNQTDQRPGLPVYSLFSGDDRGTSEAALKDIDTRRGRALNGEKNIHYYLYPEGYAD